MRFSNKFIYSIISVILTAITILTGCTAVTDNTTTSGENTTEYTTENTTETTTENTTENTPSEQSIKKLTSEEFNNYDFETITVELYPAEKFQICITDADNLIVTIELIESAPFITELTAKGTTIILDEKTDLYGNFRIDIFEVEGITVFQKLYYNSGDVYVFWDNGGFEKLRSASYWWGDYDDPNAISLSLYKDENGHMKYRRRALKYNNLQSYHDIFTVITGRDDFYEELGAVSLNDENKLGFTPQSTQTISDLYDLDETLTSLFDPSLNGFGYNGNIFYTVDEIIEYNNANELFTETEIELYRSKIAVLCDHIINCTMPYYARETGYEIIRDQEIFRFAVSLCLYYQNDTHPYSKILIKEEDYALPLNDVQTMVEEVFGISDWFVSEWYNEEKERYEIPPVGLSSIYSYENLDVSVSPNGIIRATLKLTGSKLWDDTIKVAEYGEFELVFRLMRKNNGDIFVRFVSFMPVNSVEFDIQDTMNYICEDANGNFTKENILDFDPNAYYFEPLNKEIYAENNNDVYIISENRNFNGIDGILIYGGSSNSSDNTLGSLNFIIPNITFKEYKKIIENLEIIAGQDINIAYYDDEYYQKKLNEIPEGDNHYPPFKLLREINEINDILSIYNVKDENSIINNVGLNIQTDTITIPTPRENWQEWQDFYSIFVWWKSEDIVEQRFKDILSWHKNGEKIYNELYICIHYPLA